MPTQKRISVIIPTLNEEQVIGRSLASLETQTLGKDAFDVIVVDNGSSDRTLEIAQAFGTSLDLRILTKHGASISALRNFGAAASTAAVLAFLDSDCIAPADWLASAWRLLSEQEERIIGAHYSIPADSLWVGKIWYGQMATEKRGLVSYVPGGDLLISRSTFFKIGGFDESVETSEDCDFCQRAAASGVQVLSVPALSVIHLGTPQTLGGFYRKERWHGSHVHRVLLKDIRQARNLKSVLFAAYTLVSILASLALVTVGLASNIPFMLCVAFFVPVLLPLSLAARTSVNRKSGGLLLPLALMYLVYGIARAMCLVTKKATRARSNLAGELRAECAEGNGKAVPASESARC